MMVYGRSMQSFKIKQSFSVSLQALSLAVLCSVPFQVQAQDAPLIDLGAELEQLKEKDQATTPAAPAQSTPRPAVQAPVVKHDRPQTVQKATAEPQKKPAEHPAHWGYSGAEGPEHWGDLSQAYATCKNGKNQSPIDLRDTAAIGTQGLGSLDIFYRDVPLKVINNGHSVQVNYPLGSYIKAGGKRYELMQFHFHTPSEHKKEGFNYPMEVHLVHRDGDGNLAVIAVIFQEGEENDYLNTLLQVLPKQAGTEKLYKGLSLNPAYFIPGNTEFYKYSGSLTTPPCSEGVYWMVFKHPVEASAEQIQMMHQVMGDNARPVQKLNARDVLKSWSEQLGEQPMYEFY